MEKKTKLKRNVLLGCDFEEKEGGGQCGFGQALA